MRTATIIGANGTMGKNAASIFASFGNMEVYMVARSMEKAEAAAESAGECVKSSVISRRCIAADYSMLEECIQKSDFVFESVAEDIDIKKEVTAVIGSCIANPSTIIATGTSGLSVEKLAEALPENLRKNYFGIHLFNPPYKMTLCEIIPTSYSERKTVQWLKSYMKDVLFRTPVVVKDSPAFLGNRIGFQFINEAMQYARRCRHKGGIDYIDAVLGAYTGRNMAPLATADFVGLDVHKAIVDNVYGSTYDYKKNSFLLPAYVENLVKQGHTGSKRGKGFYKRHTLPDGRKTLEVYDIEGNGYREPIFYEFPFKEQMIQCFHKGDYEKAGNILLHNPSQEAHLCIRFLLTYILYALHTSLAVGEEPQSADDVMAAGFGWCPPLAMAEWLGGGEEASGAGGGKTGTRIATGCGPGKSHSFHPSVCI